jgi:hypothetical protein
MSDLEFEPFAERAANAAAEAYRAGYAAGYQAAIAMVMQAVQAGQSPPTTGGKTTDAKLAEEPASNVPLPPPVPMAKTASGRMMPGIVKETVRRAVFDSPRPITESEIIAQNPGIKRSSAYLALTTLRKEGVLVKEGHAWAPGRKAGDLDAHTSRFVSPYTQGGTDASAQS